MSGKNQTTLTFAGDADKLSRAVQKAGSELDGFERHVKQTSANLERIQADSGDRAARSFGARMFVGMATSGINAGVAFSAEFGKTLKPALPALVGAGLVGAVAAAPAIGGLAGLGLVAGVAAGISSGKPRVKAAFTGMTSEIKQDLESVSGPMDDVLVDFARDLRELPGDNLETISRLFEKSAGMARQLTSTVRPLVENLLPGIEDALDAAGPTVDVLQDEIPELGTAVSGFLSDISEGADTGARTVQVLMDNLQSGIAITGEAIRLGNQWLDLFPPAVLMLGELGDQQDSAADAATRHAAGTEELAAAEEHAAEQARTEAAALDDVIEKLTALGRMTLSARDAERDFQAAVDDAAEAISKNGRTLDDTTEAGRRNQSALDAIASATLRKAETDMKADSSGRRATATMERGRAAFLAAAAAAGMNAQRARELAAALFAIPNIVRTLTIRERFIADARARGGRVGGGEQMHAAGGQVSGLSWINEKGPELVKFPAGSRAFSAEESKRIAGAGAGGRTVLELRAAAGDMIARMFLEMLRKAIKVEGGDVQVVLGTGVR